VFFHIYFELGVRIEAIFFTSQPFFLKSNNKNLYLILKKVQIHGMSCDIIDIKQMCPKESIS